jgi:hypothetical protein
MNAGSASIDGHSYQQLSAATRVEHITLDTFAYVNAIVRSRSFSLKDSDGNIASYLFPVMDMMNHAYGPRANVRTPENNGTHILQRALTTIKAGEEYRWDYNPGSCHRNDNTLVTYGFIMTQEPPMLCSFDLPDYQINTTTYPENDGYYYGPKGAYNTVEERMRLNHLLKSAPTTLEDDKKLLSSKAPQSYKAETLLKFRIARKIALYAAIQTIDEQLQIKPANI